MPGMGWLILVMGCGSPPISFDDVGEELDGLPTDGDVAPPPPEFMLLAGNAVANAPLSFGIAGAPPQAEVRFVTGRGLGAGDCPPQLPGGCLSILPANLLMSWVAIPDDDGYDDVSVHVPRRREGDRLTLQAVDRVSGWMSNPISRFVGPLGWPVTPDGDEDGDGYTIVDGDCADFRGDVSPAVQDLIGDGIDWNCDNTDGDDGDYDGVEDVASGGDDCQDHNPATIDCPAPSDCGFEGNLVPDCGFDGDLGGWSLEEGTSVVHDAGEGRFDVGAALAVAASGGGVTRVMYLSPCFPVSEASTWSIGGHFKVASGAQPTCNTELVQHTSTTCTGFNGTYGTGAGTLISDSAFTAFNYDNLTTGAGTQSAQVRVSCIHGGAAAFSLLVDDVYLYVPPPPPPPITLVQGPEGLDTYLRSPPLQVFDWGDNEELRVGGWGDQYYTYVQFDLTGLPAIPAASATLRLRVKGVNNAPSMFFERVTGAWDEDSAWSNQPGGAAISTVPAATAANTWYDLDVTSTFNGWMDGSYPNYGVRLRPSAYNNNNFNEFWSGDYAVAADRPQLVIVY
jgi:hypothetical protein